MKNLFLSLFAFVVFASSCKTLTSSTSIKPNDSFVLGNNEHGAFTVKLKNVSANDVEVYMAPITGGSYSRLIVKPYQVVTVSVEKNTALVVDNKSNDKALVDLKVKGDVGLSMGYKN